MLPYYFLVFTPVFLAWASTRVTIKQLKGTKNNIIVVFFLMFLVLLMFRDISCGSDLRNYQVKFEDSFSVAWRDIFNSERKYGYLALEKFVGLFTKSYRVMIMVVAVLSVSPLIYFYKRESEMPLLTITMFLGVAPFSMYFSGLCQVLAMAFAVPMWYMAKSKRWILFLLFGWMAISFHPSAVMLLALYPLYHLRFSRNSLFLIVPVLVLVFYYNGPILRYVLDILEYDRYSLVYSSAYTTLIMLIIFTLYAYIIPDEKHLDQDTVALRNILLMCVGIQLFASVQNVIMRLNYYFVIFIPVLIPKIASRFKIQMRQVVRLSIAVMNVGFLLLYFYIAYTDADYLNVYPYIPMWK